MIVPSKHPWLSFSIYNIHAPSLSMFKPKPAIPDGVIKVREVAEISQPKRDCYAAVANSRTEIFMLTFLLKLYRKKKLYKKIWMSQTICDVYFCV